MYLSEGAPKVARTIADDDGFIWRYDTSTGLLIGVTIEDFRLGWKDRPMQLAGRLHAKMKLAIKDVQQLAEILVRVADVQPQ